MTGNKTNEACISNSVLTRDTGGPKGQWGEEDISTPRNPKLKIHFRFDFLPVVVACLVDVKRSKDVRHSNEQSGIGEMHPCANSSCYKNNIRLMHLIRPWLPGETCIPSSKTKHEILGIENLRTAIPLEALRDELIGIWIFRLVAANGPIQVEIVLI